jgi:hypothetical protein
MDDEVLRHLCATSGAWRWAGLRFSRFVVGEKPFSTRVWDVLLDLA